MAAVIGAGEECAVRGWTWCRRETVPRPLAIVPRRSMTTLSSVKLLLVVASLGWWQYTASHPESSQYR